MNVLNTLIARWVARRSAAPLIFHIPSDWLLLAIPFMQVSVLH